jgi:sterol desaturase/sphingolipid hydroxylase (fatty acid hydroxylase superfamily)
VNNDRFKFTQLTIYVTLRIHLRHREIDNGDSCITEDDCVDDLGLHLVGTLRQTIEMIGVVVIPVEIMLLIWIRRQLFQGEVLVNIACGGAMFLLFRVWNLGFGLQVLLLAHTYALVNLRELLPDYVWIGLHVLAGDLCFYVFHRLAHTRLFFLLDHSVHHSSTEFNFTTNLRVSIFAPLYSWSPLLVPVLLGFDPVLLFACFGLANAVPFFLHNEHINKLGWLEYVFNTPSHHRVHHGSNPCYIDKNFGGMLIIWDRLFGTYADEVEPVIFGVRHWQPSTNPLKVMFRGWGELARSLRKPNSNVRVRPVSTSFGYCVPCPSHIPAHLYASLYEYPSPSLASSGRSSSASSHLHNQPFSRAKRAA